MSDLTDRLWDRFGNLEHDDLPQPVRQVAGQSVLDWFGCALAGSCQPLAVILRDELGGVTGPATVIGDARCTGVLQAAMLNGAAGHALDFDDAHMALEGHPTAPVLPALLAQAETDGRSGAALLSALVVGIEVETRIGAAIGPGHYARGWHQTSTIGIFGATAACARLMGLDRVRFGHAIGMAAAGSAGLKANFGTMAKPLQVGGAAERGLLSARLASRGFTSDRHALDGPQGLAGAAGDGSLAMECFEDLTSAWLTTETVYKYHAACYLAHAAMEATGSLIDPDLETSDIEEVRVIVNPAILDVCDISYPTTGLEAKFSLRGTQALVISGVDTGTITSFTDESVNRPEIQDLMRRVVVDTDANLSRTSARVEMSVAGEAGTRRASADSGRPATDLDEQGRRLRTKYDGLATPVIGESRADRLAERLQDLSGVGDVREVTRLAASND